MDRFVDFPIKHLVTGLLVVAALAAMSGAGLLIARASLPGPAIEIALPAPVATTPEQSGDIQVYLSGAVESPGVYAIADGDRLADAIEAAGGATPDADLGRVNMAARLGDEDHWHIPAVGEEIAETETGPDGATMNGAASDGIDGTGKIDLNEADATLLETLPGIGEVRAAPIVAYRQANGPFLEVEELVEVSGIGEQTLRAVRDLVEVR